MCLARIGQTTLKRITHNRKVTMKKNYTYSLELDLAFRVEHQAQRFHISQSQLVRDAIARECDRLEKEASPYEERERAAA